MLAKRSAAEMGDPSGTGAKPIAEGESKIEKNIPNKTCNGVCSRKANIFNPLNRFSQFS